MKTRRSGVILIVFGMMVALLVAIMVFSVTRKATAETNVEFSNVVVATQEIAERSVVATEALATKRLPVDVIPTGAVANITQVSGKMTATKIYPGEIILAAKLADTKGQNGFAFTLDKGKVLMTYPASDIIGTGALRVGDTVNVLVTYKGPSQDVPGQPQSSADNLPASTQTTMQNLKIVSMGSAAAAKPAGGAQSAGGNLVTFALTHQDALLLKALKDADGVQLEVVLRAAGDEEIAKTEPVTMRTIIERYRLRAQ